MTQSSEPFDPYYHWLGIPPEEQPPNHYRLLGIKLFEENRSVIQNAADRQMAHLRTFQAGPHGRTSQKVLNEVSAARICLLSPEKKTAYDSHLAATFPVSKPVTVAPPAVAPPADAGDATDNGADVAPPLVRTGTSVPTRSRVARRRSFRRTKTYTGLGILLTVIAAAAVWFMYESRTSVAPNRLVLNWPAAHRSDATVEIDGRRVPLSEAVAITDETVEFQLQPGPHEYWISCPSAGLVKGRFVLEEDGRHELEVFSNAASGIEQRRTAELILLWPRSYRDQYVLEIDGRPYDLSERHVKVSGDEVRIMLSPGKHTVALLRDGRKRMQRVVQAGSGVRVSLSGLSESTHLKLQWRPVNRVGFTLWLDGEPVDVQDAEKSDDGNTLLYEVPPGRMTLEIKQGNDVVLRRRFVVPREEPLPINLDALITQAVCRLVLEWPLDERDAATLTVDGKQHNLDSTSALEEEAVVVDVEPGDHTIRITRPHHETFEKEVIALNQIRVVPVQLKPIVALTTDKQRLEQLRDKYVGTYKKFREYRRWQRETDRERKRDALSELLSRMTREAAKMERSSPRQYVAYDEAYRLAAEQLDLLTAHSLLGRLRSLDCIGEQEKQKRWRELQNLALHETKLEVTLAFFKAAGIVGGKLSREEQQILAERLRKAPRTEEEYRALERLVRGFRGSRVLSPDVVNETRAAILMEAVKLPPLKPAERIDLVKDMLELVPSLLNEHEDQTLRQAMEIVDIAQECRRAVVRHWTATTSRAKHLNELEALIERHEDLIVRSRRIMEAKNAIRAGEGTGTQHKLLGLHLLHQAEYGEALPHLTRSGDASLVSIAVEIPKSPRDQADLVAAIELEAKRTKYHPRDKEALEAYARYVEGLDLPEQKEPNDAEVGEETGTSAEHPSDRSASE